MMFSFSMQNLRLETIQIQSGNFKSLSFANAFLTTVEVSHVNRLVRYSITVVKVRAATTSDLPWPLMNIRMPFFGHLYVNS